MQVSYLQQRAFQVLNIYIYFPFINNFCAHRNISILYIKHQAKVTEKKKDKDPLHRNETHNYFEMNHRIKFQHFCWCCIKSATLAHFLSQMYLDVFSTESK